MPFVPPVPPPFVPPTSQNPNLAVPFNFTPNKFKVLDSASGLPDVSAGVMSFLQPMKFGFVEKQMVDGYIQEVVNYKRVLGVKQAFTPAQLEIKPEGERTWNWSKIHLVSVDLPLDSIFLLGKTRYRVMARADNPEYGFIEYDVKEDFSDALPSAGDFSRPY